MILQVLKKDTDHDDFSIFNSNSNTQNILNKEVIEQGSIVSNNLKNNSLFCYTSSNTTLPAENICHDKNGKMPYFSYSERYSECLKHSSNIMKLFTTSQSILNINFCKKIHKDECPLDSKEFVDFDNVVYLLLKSDSNNQAF